MKRSSLTLGTGLSTLVLWTGACGPVGGPGPSGSSGSAHDSGASASSGSSASGAGESSGSSEGSSGSEDDVSDDAASGSASDAETTHAGDAASSGSGTTGSSDASSGSSMPSGACTDHATAAGTITQQYGTTSIAASATKSYVLTSNWWHTFASETEAYSGLSFTVHNPQNASVPQSDGAPMGFPSLFIGQYGGNTSVGSNLPKQVSALTSVPTIYRTNNATIGTSNHNATYDVWFTQSGSPLPPGQSSPGAGGAYLMVWMFKPTDRQPRGSDSGHTGQTVAGVSGSWNVWVDNSNPPCISYVSTTPLDGLAFDLADFIDDAVTKGYGLTKSMYLSLVFGGFEIWGGGDGLQLTQFCATVN